MSDQKYDHQSIEKRWQDYWMEHQSYQTPEPNSEHPKKYLLAMFPYPSGDGLHVGHVEVYTGTDVLARYHRMTGSAVLHPMGWDSFGLPAENYAIKKGIPPQETTAKNIERYRQQLNSMGFSYDWDKEISTSSPDYYRWTQWMFLQLFKAGLAYQQEAAVNWCPSCQTVLANEQVVNGECERCGSAVEQKKMRQWFFKITNYAEELLSKLDTLNWPESIKSLQRNWIGRSEGARLTFAIDGHNETIDVFTTRVDTLAGATYLVLAPEHPLVEQITTESNQTAVHNYQIAAKKKSELDRLHLERDKTGVCTGAMAINPLNGQKIPVWVADYVVMGYGTGAIMAVPAHDERDFVFAKKYKLPIIKVVDTGEGVTDQATVTDGVLVNSGQYDGLSTEQAKEKITAHLAAKQLGRKEVNYRLRDWLISRQRYWGAPIPIIHCGQCGAVPVAETELPVLLPDDVDFKPHGHSPLADSQNFVAVKCPNCGGEARRETDTMDTFVCSSWYFLRYPSAKYNESAFNEQATKTWLPVDRYIGGAEHAVLHLLYARFFTKFLRDQGYLDFDEPFLELHNAGIILGADHQKMSKSKGNVANPDEVVAEYGADVLRLHELFLGPYSDEKPWSTESIKGSRRFLESLYDWAKARPKAVTLQSSEQVKFIVAQTISKVTTDTETLHFNTAIAQCMTALNVMKRETVGDDDFEAYLKLLAPYAPHLISEIWSWNHAEDIHSLTWPESQPVVGPETVNIAIQVNGRLRGTVEAEVNATETKLTELAKANSNVNNHLDGRNIVRVVTVPNRVVNFIVTD